jgi:hypothetical protein
MKTNYKIGVSQSLLVLGLAAAAVVFAILWFKVMAASNSGEKNSGAPSSTELTRRTSPLPSSAQREQVESELITILPTGFHPTQIMRPSGKFLLAVENRSGIKQVDLRLNAESGDRLFQVSRTWERADWNEVVNPPPGRYVLTEASHPEWQCVITITQ